MSPRNDTKIYLKSMDFPNEVEVDLNKAIEYKIEDGWEIMQKA